MDLESCVILTLPGQNLHLKNLCLRKIRPFRMIPFSVISEKSCFPILQLNTSERDSNLASYRPSDLLKPAMEQAAQKSLH
jgi:hypothetical protein